MRNKIEIKKNLNYKLRKNDIVYVIGGKAKGKTGKIIKVLNDKDRVIVEKLMMVKRHIKNTQQQQGGITEKEGSIHISNVMLMCGKCNRPTRIGYSYLEDGQKTRICKKCKEIII